MVVAVWSVKGGVGVSTVAVMLALAHAERAEESVLVDLMGAAPTVLGCDTPDGPGVADWCSTPGADGDALARLEVEVRPRLRLIPRGSGPLSGNGQALVDVLGSSRRRVVVDCGVVDGEIRAANSVVDGADQSILVLRECFIALRAAQRCDRRPTGVVVIKEPRRHLGRPDVETVADAPVVAEIAFDSAIARAIDSGLLHARLPRTLLRSMSRVVPMEG